MVVKKFFVGLATLCAVVLFAGAVQGCASAAATSQSVAFPMYEYPTVGTLWSDIRTAGSKVPWIIANPASGPGTTVDSLYTAALNALPTGQRAIGYVYTSYQARSLSAVLADIDKWYTLYPQISGIFVDLLQNGTSSDLCYAATVYNYIKSKHPNDLVVQNFGANVHAQYEPYGDIFGNSENTYAVYQSWAPTADGFENNATYADRFWHIVHTTNTSDMSAALSLTRTNNAGWVLITDKTMPNPYTSVPTYWSTFLTQVASLPQTAVPNRGLTALPSGCIDLSMTTSTTTSVGTQQITYNNASTVLNADSARTSWGPTSITYTVPSGATLNSLSGTGWTCSVATKKCEYTGDIAASGSLPAVTAAVVTTCSYISGNATATLKNFANNTATTSFSVAKPGDCSGGTSPSTNISGGATTAINRTLRNYASQSAAETAITAATQQTVTTATNQQQSKTSSNANSSQQPAAEQQGFNWWWLGAGAAVIAIGWFLWWVAVARRAH